MKQAISTSFSNSIFSPKQADNIVLAPNREILQQYIARTMDSVENDGVQIAPPAFIFSTWVESLAARFRMLQGRRVPGSLDAWTSQLTWAANTKGRFEHAGRAFDMAAARQARDADRALRQWLGNDESLWLDERFFAIRSATHRAFEARSLFSPEDWIQDLTGQLNEGDPVSVSLPASISLIGFIELTTQESGLIRALEEKGVSVSQHSARDSQSQIRVYEFQTPEDEWQAAARWAQEKLEEGVRRLAIVLPGEVTTSGSASRRIRKLLCAVFHPENALLLDHSSTEKFYIPNACALSECSVVRDALLLLRMTLAGVDADLEFPDLSRWLLSRHWFGSDVELCARAKLELLMRDRDIHQVSLSGLRKLAGKSGLEEQVQGLISRISNPPQVQIDGDAGECFLRILIDWGWPGETVENAGSSNVDQLLALLEHLGTLEPESPEQALEALELMISGTRYSFGGGPLSPVQILTPEVAALGGYEGVWICNNDEASWPPPITANPFIPASARVRIPRMNPEGQHDYYKKLTDQLRHAGAEVCFSWSRDGGQGLRRRSGLIADLDSTVIESQPATDLATTIWPDAVLTRNDRAQRLDWIDDDHTGLPFAAEDSIRLPGGSGFFRLQAACPLLGYMKYRLGADFPAVPTAQASPQYRGELMHQALRELYRPVVNTDGKPDAGAVPSAVEAALIRLGARERLTASGYRAEHQRLIDLLREWLILDNAREGFTVEAVEETRSLRSGPCEINIRFDRLDRLSDGTFLVLDYKSSGGGASRALKWIRPRIQEPQLPLYAVLLEEDGQSGSAGGLAFANVSQGKCGFDGISDDAESSPVRGIRAVGRGAVRDWDWASLLDHWRSQVGMLRQEILDGRADNCIYDTDIVEWSGLDLILRLAEVQQQDADGDDVFGAGE